MSQGTLYKTVAEGENLRTRAIFPVSLVNHYKLDIKLSDPDSHFPAEYPGKFVPAFRYPNGDTLTESIPIALLLIDLIPNKGTLYGNGSEADKALILSWMNRFNNDFMNPLAVQLRIILGAIPPSKSEWEASKAKVERYATIINDHLTKNTYLVGETVTAADLYGVPMLLRALTVVWGADLRTKYSAIMRWFNTVSADPFFNGFFDGLKLVEQTPAPKLE